jgi:hypothetical protein
MPEMCSEFLLMDSYKKPDFSNLKVATLSLKIAEHLIS